MGMRETILFIAKRAKQLVAEATEDWRRAEMALEWVSRATEWARKSGQDNLLDTCIVCRKELSIINLIHR